MILIGGGIVLVAAMLVGKFGTAFDFEFGGSADSEQTRTLSAQVSPIGTSFTGIAICGRSGQVPASGCWRGC